MAVSSRGLRGSESRGPTVAFLRKVMLPGLGLSAAFYLLDTAVDVLLVPQVPFWDHLLRPSPLELWVRLLIAGVCFFFIGLLVYGRRTRDDLAIFARAVEEAQDGVQLVALDGRIAYSNRAVEPIFGFGAAELEGRSVNELSVDPELATREILPGIQKSGRWEGEVLVKHRDGSTRSLWLAASPVRDRTGHRSAILAVIRDVTARKESEATLRERERLAALGADVGAALVQGETLRASLTRCSEAVVRHLDAAFARIWTYDPDQDALELQASAGRYTRIDGSHARVKVGNTKIGLIARTRRPNLSNEVTEDPAITDHQWARREGLVAFAGYPLVVEDRLVGVLAMFSTRALAPAALDALAAVANAIALGIERSRAHEALQQSEERFRRVFEEGPMGMAMIDLERRFVRVNRALCEMVGYPEPELVGKSLYDITHPADLAAEEAQLSRMFLGKIPFFALDKRYVRKDGEVIWIHLVASVLRDKDGKPKLGLGMIEDITARRRAADALREAKDRAEAADRTKAEFLDIASHELRTPLTALRLQVQHTLAQLRAGTAIEAAPLERMVRQTGRLNEMVNDLLDASRLEHGRLQLHPSPLDLRQLVETVSEEFRARAPARRIPVSLPAEPALVQADPARIEQVIANLLDNALKYSADDTAVEVALTLEPDQVRVSVTDRGRGIPPEQRGQLFNRFFRVDANVPRQQPGLGLGLYICRMIIKPHGGTIGVDSAVGQGSTFHFTLPRRGELR